MRYRVISTSGSSAGLGGLLSNLARGLDRFSFIYLYSLKALCGADTQIFSIHLAYGPGRKKPGLMERHSGEHIKGQEWPERESSIVFFPGWE